MMRRSLMVFRPLMSTMALGMLIVLAIGRPDGARTLSPETEVAEIAEEFVSQSNCPIELQGASLKAVVANENQESLIDAIVDSSAFPDVSDDSCAQVLTIQEALTGSLLSTTQVDDYRADVADRLEMGDSVVTVSWIRGGVTPLSTMAIVDSSKASNLNR